MGTFERKQFDQKKAKEKAAKQQEKEKARMRAISSAPSLSNTGEGDGDGTYSSSQKGYGSSTSSVSNSGWLKGSGPVVGGRLKAYPISCGYATQLQTHNTFNLPCLSKHGNQSIFKVTILPFKLYDYYDNNLFYK